MKEIRGKQKKKKRKRRRYLKKFIPALVAVLLICVVLLYGYVSKGKKEELQTTEQKEVNVLSEDGRAQEDATWQHGEDEGKDGALTPSDEIELEEIVDASAPEDLTLTFGGDVCFHDEYANMGAFRNRGSSIDQCLSPDLLKEMRNTDICMVNNEFAYSNRGTPLEGKAFTLRSKPENVQILKDMGVDIVSVANNHVFDFGADAFLDTLATLKNAGMPYVGAGANIEEASKPYYYKTGGRTIAFVSATQVERNENPDTKGATESSPGTLRCYTKQEFARVEQSVKEAEEQADLTIVYIHWGSENTDELHWEQIEQAPALVKAGADLIVGDHPHVLQGIDFIDGVPVFYSLGNFWFNSKTLDTMLLKVYYEADGSLICQVMPALQHDCRTDLVTDGEKTRILQYLQCISGNVTIDENGFVEDKPYTGPPIDKASVSHLPPPKVAEPVVKEPVVGTSTTEEPAMETKPDEPETPQ